IQIHRNDVRSANGSEAFSIGEPSAGEIESAFSTSTQLPVDFSFLSSGFIRGLHIFFVTLLPRHVEVIPVAIEYRSIFHAHNSLEWFSSGNFFRTIHPKRILLFHGRKKFNVHRISLDGSKEFYHRGEERRLRPAEIV